MERKIKVTIDPLGIPKIEAEGFLGGSCEEATLPIEKALQGGDGNVERVFKPDYYAVEDTTQHVEQTW